jgi:xanthine dehydrogenase accessory factor
MGGAERGRAGGVNVLVEAGRLAGKGTPFALATVVGVERPSSARVGDRALVMQDGKLHGWVGGACTEPEVVRLALESLGDGEVRRERIESRCASEGAVEVLIEPQRPAPLLAVVGDAPAARTLRELAGVLGWRTTATIAGADAVVIASMGRGDEEALEAALASGAGYVGLVASAKRASAVSAELRARGVDEEALARIRSPAGLDLGPSTQEEIGVAVLAELVAWRHLHRASDEVAVPEGAIDPICGMTVAIATAAHRLEHEGTTYYFCGPGCLRKFQAALV